MNAEKLVQAIAMTVAGLFVTRALTLVWKKAFGHEPSIDANEDGTRVREAVLFAAISGALAALARAGASRAAKSFMARSLDPKDVEALGAFEQAQQESSAE